MVSGNLYVTWGVRPTDLSHTTRVSASTIMSSPYNSKAGPTFSQSHAWITSGAFRTLHTKDATYAWVSPTPEPRIDGCIDSRTIGFVVSSPEAVVKCYSPILFYSILFPFPRQIDLLISQRDTPATIIFVLDPRLSVNMQIINHFGTSLAIAWLDVPFTSPLLLGHDSWAYMVTVRRYRS